MVIVMFMFLRLSVVNSCGGLDLVMLIVRLGWLCCNDVRVGAMIVEMFVDSDVILMWLVLLVFYEVRLV